MLNTLGVKSTPQQDSQPVSATPDPYWQVIRQTLRLFLAMVVVTTIVIMLMHGLNLL